MCGLRLAAAAAAANATATMNAADAAGEVPVLPINGNLMLVVALEEALFKSILGNNAATGISQS